MLQFSFKNRLAFNFLISTALIVGILFVIIYSIVKFSIYSDVNKDIEHEIAMHFSEMDFNNNIDKWIDVHEWEEREHNDISIDPVFVQIYNPSGISIEKSPNLKYDNLHLNKSINGTHFCDTDLHHQTIRQVQVPIFKNAKIKGYLLIAMSLEEESVVLNNLLKVLFISYLVLLFSLFYITRFIAGKSIVPIIEITKTTESISRENLTSRIELPHNKDELFVLSKTINDLLDRIENAVSREKQFTSDASHELRTPLAVIKGTLEVLVRKPREKQEYEEKVNFCIQEVNRLNNLVDELLLLARFENQKHNVRNENVYLNALILDCLSRYSQIINDKNLGIKNEFGDEYYVQSDYYLMDIIVSNLLSNAIKYSNESG
ncbi:MAG TPA: histidine kinase dimerization/phospho-acceptor domain-containing protein, partial [Flavobacterium sp.]|nr:histidine kinase dimerization/phospho-acceptor domain-containing protein [Flavobacterium sp.]